MLHRFVTIALPLALAAGSLAPPLVAQGERRLDDPALEPLARAIALRLESGRSGADAESSRTALFSALAELRERLDGGDPLALPSDLGRALWLSRGYAARKVRAGKVQQGFVSSAAFPDETLEVAWRLPKDYDPGGAGHSLLLAIPDAGERPADHLRTHWTHRPLLENAILVCPQMPAERAEWDQVSIAGRPGGLCHVLSALRWAVEDWAIDPDRVFVVGRGKGVPAAFAAGDHAPQRFAAVLGRGGDLGGLGPGNFQNLPTWFAGAGAGATAFAEAARATGHDNCTLEPTAKEPQLWEFVEGTRRQPAPRALTLVVGQPFPTRVHWLRVAPIASDARASAEIDRDANTIRIEGQGVAQATLYLNDALVDLDAPLRVVCNGVENTVRVARSASTMLDLVREGESDAGCVYVAELAFDMTGERPALALDAGAGMDGEFDRRLAGAAGDQAALWALHAWCTSSGRSDGASAVLRCLLRQFPDDARAHEAAGQVRAEERWFTSPEALAQHQRRQDPEAAAAVGYVEHRGVWMHPDERARANKGALKDPESGLWLSVSDRKRFDQGWVLQDAQWIPPAEAAQADRGLWRVDGEWFELAEATRRRARIESMWVLPGPDVLLYTTVERPVAARARAAMRRAIGDLDRVFGARPVLPLPVCVLRDEEQYDRFAFGDPDGRRAPTHNGRRHVVHTAFLAESWFAPVEGALEARPVGVCYWDALVPNGDAYGVHAARLAVGLSYVEALDPSPKALRAARRGGPEPGHFEAWRAEKQLPEWLRFGGAVYAERYFNDPTVAEGGDPWWPRAWSLDNLRARGGLRPLAEVFAFPLDPDDRDDGLKLLIESGLLVAFLVDGACAPAAEALADVQRALRHGRLHANQIEALEAALVEHEAQLRAFAGF